MRRLVDLLVCSGIYTHWKMTFLAEFGKAQEAKRAREGTVIRIRQGDEIIGSDIPGHRGARGLNPLAALG